MVTQPQSKPRRQAKPMHPDRRAVLYLDQNIRAGRPARLTDRQERQIRRMARRHPDA